MTELKYESPASAARGAPDFDLLAKIGRGDQRAMASLYDRHSGLVYSVALRVCHDSTAAEEVLQNIFLRIWLAPQQFASETGTFATAVTLIARNTALECMRRRAPSEPGYCADRCSDLIGHTEVKRWLGQPHSLVLLLPDADRRVLEMAFFDGKTTVEIADETGLPLETIPGRIRGALSALRSGKASSDAEDTGLEVLDLDSHAEFAGRTPHTRDLDVQMEGLRRLTHSFVESPDTILQELVDAAVDLCGADSAGISVEHPELNDDAHYWHWVATAGEYNGFMNAVLPRYPSACGICLERGRPQLFRVRQKFFDIMGINAPLVTDGILLPWQVEETRGTIFIMAHGRSEAFDKSDGQMMQVLADLAAMAARHHRQQYALLQQAKAAGAAAVANKLAHRINNPLQSLMNVAYLAAEGKSDQDAKALGRTISADLQRLSTAVTESLTPPTENAG